MKKLLLLAVFSLTVLTLGAATPTGSISLNDADLHYGDTATFTTSTTATKGNTYVNVVCLQGSEVVFQSSVPPFVLTDQSGDNLNWDGQAASCVGSLVNRVKHGRTVTIAYLDQATFEVAA